jgi:hypothetical protein
MHDGVFPGKYHANHHIQNAAPFRSGSQIMQLDEMNGARTRLYGDFH